MDFHRRPGCPFQFLVRFSGSPLRIKHLKKSSHATSSAKSDQYSHTVQLKKRTIHTQKLAGSSPVVPTILNQSESGFHWKQIRIFIWFRHILYSQKRPLPWLLFHDPVTLKCIDFFTGFICPIPQSASATVYHSVLSQKISTCFF